MSMGEITALITGLAVLVGSFKVVEGIVKARQSRASGIAADEVAANASLTTSWQAIQKAQNQNIVDIWAELNWLREEREFDIEYIDELHAHIDELRDHIVLGKGLPIPATPRRRKRRSPPPMSRNPADVAAELGTTTNQGATP